VGGSTALPGTTSARSDACAESTPKYLSKRKRGGGTSAHNLAMKSCGESTTAIRGRNPTFAVSGVAGAYAAVVRPLRDFQRAYAEARARWRAGFRDVVFPAGTWWMVRGHSAVVAALP